MEEKLKVGDRVEVGEEYETPPPNQCGRFSYEYPSKGMKGVVVGIFETMRDTFKNGIGGRLCLCRPHKVTIYIVKIDDSERRGCFYSGEFGFSMNELKKVG